MHQYHGHESEINGGQKVLILNHFGEICGDSDRLATVAVVKYI